MVSFKCQLHVGAYNFRLNTNKGTTVQNGQISLALDASRNGRA